jgi:hypothetical protein
LVAVPQGGQQCGTGTAAHHLPTTTNRDGSGGLTLQQVLRLLPALKLVSAAAQLLLLLQQQQAPLPQASAADAAQQQGSWLVLQDVLEQACRQAFYEADPARTGVVRPGEQCMQLAFAAAAQLAGIIAGAAQLQGSKATQGETGTGGCAANTCSLSAAGAAVDTACFASVCCRHEHQQWRYAHQEQGRLGDAVQGGAAGEPCTAAASQCY